MGEAIQTRTGIMDREAACANLDENGSWHISDRREPPPGKPKVKPEDMTEEQGELAMEEWREAYEEWESRMNDLDNPETGEWRRVNKG